MAAATAESVAMATRAVLVPAVVAAATAVVAELQLAVAAAVAAVMVAAEETLQATMAAVVAAAMMAVTENQQVPTTAVAAVVIALPIMVAAGTAHLAAAVREKAAFVFCSTLSTLNKGVITYENIPDCR